LVTTRPLAPVPVPHLPPRASTDDTLGIRPLAPVPVPHLPPRASTDDTLGRPEAVVKHTLIFDNSLIDDTTLATSHHDVLAAPRLWASDELHELAARGYYCLQSTNLALAISERLLMYRQPLQWPYCHHEMACDLITFAMIPTLVSKPPRCSTKPPFELISDHQFQGRRVVKVNYVNSTPSQQMALRHPTAVWPPPTLADALVLDSAMPKILTIREGLALLAAQPLELNHPVADNPWPIFTSYHLPKPLVARFSRLDLEATAWIKQQLPTFSRRHLIEGVATDLAYFPWPTVNIPPTTLPRPLFLAAPEEVDVGPLFRSREWQQIIELARNDAIDHSILPKESHRRRAQPFILTEERSLQLSNGHIVDLRPCLGTDGWPISERALTMPEQEIEDNELNVEFMEAVAADLAIEDQELLQQLRYGFTNDSSSPRSTRIYPALKGAFTFRDEVQESLDHDIAQGWISKPYPVPPFWPFIAPAKNGIQQYKGHGKMSVRVTTDCSELQTPDSVNAGIDLDSEPPHEMVRIHDFLTAIAILLSTFDDVYLWKLDLSKFYRRVPKSHKEKYQQGILWNGKFYGDQRCVFGDASMVHKATRLANFITACLKKLRNRRHQEQFSNQPLAIPREVLIFARDRLRRLGSQHEGVTFFLEYIDDLLGCAPTRQLALDDMNAAVEFITNCGLTIQQTKVVGPVQNMEALGVLISIPDRTARISDTFVDKLQYKSQHILHNKTVPAKLIESLAYSYQHLANFNPDAKPLATQSLDYWFATRHRSRITISKKFEALIRTMNDYALSKPAVPLVPSLAFPARGHYFRIDIEMDASGDYGWGFIALPSLCHDERSVYYAHGTWNAQEIQWAINEKELLVSAYAAILLTSFFPQYFVVEAIDNTVAERVAILNKSSGILLRELLQLRNEYHRNAGWTVHEQRIATKDNTLADALSRGNLQDFIQAAHYRRIPASRLKLLTLFETTRQQITSRLTQAPLSNDSN